MDSSYMCTCQWCFFCVVAIATVARCISVCLCALCLCVTRDVILPVTSVAWSWLPSCWLPWDQTDTSSASMTNLFPLMLKSLNTQKMFCVQRNVRLNGGRLYITSEYIQLIITFQHMCTFTMEKGKLYYILLFIVEGSWDDRSRASVGLRLLWAFREAKCPPWHSGLPSRHKPWRPAT